MTANARLIVDALACGVPGCPCQVAARKGTARPTARPMRTTRRPSMSANVTARRWCIASLAATRRPCSTRSASVACGQAGGEGAGIPPDARAHTHTPADCTLEQYAAVKQLPVDFLRSLGLSTINYQSAPAVRMAYSDEHGNEAAIRFRLSLTKGTAGDNRFHWKSGSKAMLYGLWRSTRPARLAGSRWSRGRATVTPSGAMTSQPSACRGQAPGAMNG